MPKKFIYMLMLAFTLQISWGVASAYCMHETGKAVQHFGHHPHQHAADAPGVDALGIDTSSVDTSGIDAASTIADDHQGSPSKKLAADPDCASCTHSPLAAYTWGIKPAQPLLPVYRFISLLSDLPSPYLGMPERPQWLVAA
ncbi:hypothetical protein ACO0LO_04005 [Undibacterium sp. TJN25]|uniref:hypothetical protein n=1 Tax=Undibacterium sp. TJN25 TaxID=3413056 RepID=UPI003BF31EF7